MKLVPLLLIIALAVAVNIAFYLWLVRRLFGRGTFEAVPKEGYFVFRIPEKNFQYNMPILDYERSKEEPVPVPGTDKIYLYRGEIYENLEDALDKMARRSGAESVKMFRERLKRSPGPEPR